MKNNPYAKNMNTLVFDIETTGLNPKRDHIITAGLCEADGSLLRQYFCERPVDEPMLIKNVLEELSDCDAVITYNGTAFDIPFLQTRARLCGVTEDIPLFASFDVYGWLRKYWPKAKDMAHLRQKDIEEAFGLSNKRKDHIGGELCIPLYEQYISRGVTKAKDDILLHNADDVRQLAAITDVLSFLPYHRIAFNEGFPMRKELQKVRVDSISLGNALKATAKTEKGLLPISIFSDAYKLDYESETGSIHLEIALRTDGSIKYVDLKEFPFESAIFSTYSGYHSDYLALSEGDELLYREINALARTTLEAAL